MRKFLGLMVVLAGMLASGWAFAASFVIGDVFASTGNGKVTVFSNTGVFKTTLDTGLGGYTTGSAFDAGGNFYVTAFSANKVSKFNSAGTLLNASWATGLGSNESIVFDQTGNAYIGNAGANAILKVNSSGAPIQTLSPLGSNTDWIDLAADQKTIIYSDESQTIRRWDASTNTALSNFATVGSSSNFAKRIRPNGDLMVANGDGKVYRLDSTGLLVQTYSAGIGSVFALNLDPDGTSFWTGSTGGTTIERIDIATGAILTTFNTGVSTAGSGGLFGLSVLGEITQGCGTACTNPSVPEPGSLVLAATALGLLGISVRRRRQGH